MLHNEGQLTVAYGYKVVDTVRQTLFKRLGGLVQEVTPIEGGFLLSLTARLEADTVWLEDVLLKCSYEPIRHEEMEVIPVVSAAFAFVRPALAGVASIERCGPGEIIGLRPAQYCSAWRNSYRFDMACAVEFIRNLQQGKVSLVFQPVRGIADRISDLYQEALLRVASSQGEELRGGLQSISALERLGLVRLLDHCVLHGIIDLLRADPALRLGCNLSAQSAVPDAWWGSAFAQLARDPDLAKRLTLELTETVAPCMGKELVAFIAHLHRLGCRVAADDFGTGYSGVGVLLDLKFDIVKLDKRFLHAARLDSGSSRLFEALLQLCQQVAPQIVVEGVEQLEDLQRLESLGLPVWGQGFFWGMPKRPKSLCLVAGR